METVGVPLSVLKTCAEDAQIRAAVAKSIVAEMEEIGKERIGYDERGQWHDYPHANALHEQPNLSRPGVDKSVWQGVIIGAVISIPIWMVIVIIWAIYHFFRP